MKEIYKPIKNFENKYLVSNYGNIKSVILNKILKKQSIANGYLTSTLAEKPYLIHILVINTFSNDNILDIVDHIDGNKQNNNIKNLRYATFSENTINAYKNNPNMKKRLTKVHKYDIHNNLIKIYNSMAECKKENNISNSSVIINASNNNKLINNFYYKAEEKQKNNIKINYEDIITNNHDETFKIIDIFIDDKFTNYYISNYGKVYNKNKKIIMKIVRGTNGYDYISLISDDSKICKIAIHRLVAYIFIEKYDKTKIINHIDENKNNNYYKNLEITTAKENIRHSLSTKIIKYNLDMKIIKKYNCMKDATDELNIKQSGNISKCCQGKLKTAYGFIWKFDN